jgi:hypothetical protein
VNAEQTIRQFMSGGQLGFLSLSSYAADIRARIEQEPDTAARSRKDRRPAILRYGWVQIFLDKDSVAVDGIGIYVPLNVDAEPQPLLSIETQEFLQALSPAKLLALLDGVAVSVVAGDTVPPRQMMCQSEEDFRRLPATLDDVRVQVVGGADAIFDRPKGFAAWTLQKVMFWRGSAGREKEGGSP